MSQKKIVIKGAKQHNLQDVNLEIPRDKFVVITGLSGSGKSSLAFDTIYAEGQRRYVESLSSYARMFLGQMNKPEVDSIDGLSPAVSIDQKTTSKNPRSTVGTTTEIYDYLRLLFARVGIAHCPECGREIESQTTDQVTDEILKLGKVDKDTQSTKSSKAAKSSRAVSSISSASAAKTTRAIIMAPIVSGKKGEYTKLFANLLKRGFSRVRIDGKITKLDGDPIRLNKQIKHFIDVVIDRVQLKSSATSRIAEAVELATKLSDGRVLVQILKDKHLKSTKNLSNSIGASSSMDEDTNAADEVQEHKTSSGAKGGLAEGEYLFSLAMACPEHGHSLDKLEPRDFSFNAPYGSCPDCAGLGSKDEIDTTLIVPDPSLSIVEGCIRPFKSGNYYPQVLQAVTLHLGEDPYKP